VPLRAALHVPAPPVRHPSHFLHHRRLLRLLHHHLRRPHPLLPPPSSLPRPRRRSYVYAFYLEKSGNHKANFEMQQSQLEMQTEELAGLLERDVKDIQRTEASHQPPPSRTSSSAPAPACQPATARVSADSTAAPPRAPGPGHPT
jgi:hypothetical protein